MTVPALHVAGWYDVFLEGTLENFGALRSQGAAEQSLIVGPWFHMPWAPTVGDRDFGPEARNLVDDAQVRFFRRTLLGEDTGPEPAVRLFVMGEDRWRSFDTWPPPADELRLHLGSDGRAASVNGTGALSAEPPAGTQRPDVWASDPSLPVCTRGGRSASAASQAPMGPADQRPEETRNDVLVYSTPPLEQAVTVIGVPAATLWCGSDSASSDVIVRLVDVHPDGTAINVSDGNLRVAWDDRRRPRELEIRMSPTAIRFHAGHRIRLEVMGTSFPLFDRNAGTRGTLDAAVDELRVVTQVVFHDPGRPSRLTLPVVG
jgi:putative CocE/NonD family hydrolase